jgi:hypothetical protein
MWVITYTIDYHDLDRDNRPDCRTGEVESATGETLKDALNQFLKETATKGMISNYANPSSSWGYSSVEIINCFRVTKEVELDFEHIPVIRERIEKQRATFARAKLAEERKEKNTKRASERATLKRLKEKYEK